MDDSRSQPMDDSGAPIWRKAVALTAVFLLGGALGYLVGRPSRVSVAPDIGTDQVRVPELSGLTVEAATRVLESLGLGARTAAPQSSDRVPQGVVLDQHPGRGSILPRFSDVDLVPSLGPGPGVGPEYVFARSVLVRIDHAGTYRWTSPAIALAGPPASLGANTRVIGRATVSPYRVSPDPTPGATRMEVSFDVSGFRSPAWFVILRAYARQRESSVQEPSLTVTPPEGPAGSMVTVEGHLCQGRSIDPNVTVLAIVSRPGKFVVGTFRSNVTASAYGFILLIRIPARSDAFELARGGPILPGDRIRFQASPACVTSPDLVVN
ncbi:MAG: PASTA domain-containing protein [Actinomycetota bacterium]|nr:PASTA domain-containing protein [Actinomycetota bacterium]